VFDSFASTLIELKFETNLEHAALDDFFLCQMIILCVEKEKWENIGI
jgi:hypothetical protein